MEIAQYIVDLLRGQDEVSVAGLGTFSKLRLAGFFDQDTNTFHPPSYTISFKAVYTEDNSLAKYLIKKENLSESLAEESIKNFSSTILNNLQQENLFEIDSFGAFQINEGIISFEASNSKTNTVNISRLNPVQDLNSTNSSTQIEPIQTEIIEEFNQIEEKIVSDELEENIDEIEETPKSRSWIKIFIAFILFLTALVALFFLNRDFRTFIENKSAGLFNQSNGPEQLSPVLIDSSKITADSLNSAIDSASILSDSLRQAQDSSLIIENDTLSTIKNSDIPTFEIISAAFAKKSEAEVYMKELSKKGIQSKIVENMPGKMLKISLGTFLDEESAKIELRRIHKEINKDAWIARINPNK